MWKAQVGPVSEHHYGSCAISLGYNWCTCAHIQDRRDAMHAPGLDGLYGQSTLCGIEAEVGRSLWMTQIRDDINCAVCRSLNDRTDALFDKNRIGGPRRDDR